MSYIPDTSTKKKVSIYGKETDENNGYYEGLVSQNDKRFLNGVDWCAEEFVDNFFDNLEDECEDDEVYEILTQELPPELQSSYEMEFSFGGREVEHREVKTVADYIRDKLLEYIELQRNETVVSMIDGMDEKEYAENYRKVFGEDLE